jgi:hypothetical protein
MIATLVVSVLAFAAMFLGGAFEDGSPNLTMTRETPKSDSAGG